MTRGILYLYFMERRETGSTVQWHYMP